MPNLDGIQKKDRNLIIKIEKKTEIKNQIRVHSFTVSKKLKLFGLIDRKQLVTIVATFFVTFAFSIATSQGLAAMQQPNMVQAADATPGSSNTNSELAVLTTTGTPDVPIFDPNVLTRPDEVYLPKEGIKLPDPLQKRREFLEQYLRAKGSPLANHVDAISNQSQWKLIIGISRAESSFCKHQVTNNCWGIGGAWNMKNYKNFDQAVADVNRILEEHYIQAGLDTPKKIERKYVGYPSKNWEMAVQQELDNLADVE